MRLGRLSHDPARLAAVPAHYGALMTPPALDRGSVPFVPGLYQNDILPDCTAVGTTNAARGTAWVQTGADIVVVEAKVPAFFALCAGCADDIVAMAATDGAMILDALDRASAGGLDLGGQTALVPYWERCEAGNRVGLAHAMLTGPAVLGVELAGSDHGLIGQTWDLGLGAGDATPGSWGGHCLIAWDYTGLGDTDIVRLGTWGAWQNATWRWLQSRLAEAYAVTWRQLQSAEQ